VRHIHLSTILKEKFNLQKFFSPPGGPHRQIVKRKLKNFANYFEFFLLLPVPRAQDTKKKN